MTERDRGIEKRSFHLGETEFYKNFCKSLMEVSPTPRKTKKGVRMPPRNIQEITQ